MSKFSELEVRDILALRQLLWAKHELLLKASVMLGKGSLRISEDVSPCPH